MSVALISLCALGIAVIVSSATRINVGILAIVLAWIVGIDFAGLQLSEILAAFPTQLFLTLTGVTLLFTQAHLNGTLDRVAHHAVRGCRGNVGLIPIMFFFLASFLASIGPGSTAMAAIIGPMAMRVAERAKISAFLMAVMVANGANSGSLSPIAPTGIIVNGLLAKIGITGVEWQNYLTVVAAHAAVAFAGYFLFGGLRLLRRTMTTACDALPSMDLEFRVQHWVTIAVIAGLMIAVIVFERNAGMAAFTGALLLTALRCSGPADPVKHIPWGPILMVSGVTVLVGLLQKTGGMELFSSLLARFSTQHSVTAVVAFVTGVISVYSSTSGVVLPAFIPTVPGLVERLGGVDALSIAWSMFVGAHLVDISPLSTTGALCIASAPAAEDHRLLFNKLLAWGLSMSVVGAVASYVCFGVLRQ